MKLSLILALALFAGACAVESQGRGDFGGKVTSRDGSAGAATAGEPAAGNGRFFPSPLPPPPAAPERVPGRNLPTFATEEGGRALTEAEMNEWRAARAADSAYQEAVRNMQAHREWRASHGMLTAFDGGKCTLAQSPEKCREARARMDESAQRWIDQSKAARERGEP